jgi:proline racemase/trans-L-3-hydroxyproline dehydratase
MARFTRIINTIDSHTAGEPTRLVVSGVPPLPGDTMAEKMRYARRELDDLRSRLMLEPRGRQDMYGALLTAPGNPAADFGLVFMNTRQYTTMCGHAVIGATTTVLETGMIMPVEPETEVVFETPVGLVRTVARVEDGRVLDVSFTNTPVFVYALDRRISDPELGELTMDVVYSGGFFALVAAEQISLELIPENARVLGDLGSRLSRVADEQINVRHPEHPFVNVIDAVEFHGPALRNENGVLEARSVAIFGDRTVDRSPCGTGTCARMAVLHARGDLCVGQSFVSESMIGTQFVGQILKETKVGDYDAVVPQVTGRAFLTGFHQFVLDPDDPFPRGFSVAGQDDSPSGTKDDDSNWT